MSRDGWKQVIGLTVGLVLAALVVLIAQTVKAAGPVKVPQPQLSSHQTGSVDASPGSTNTVSASKQVSIAMAPNTVAF